MSEIDPSVAKLLERWAPRCADVKVKMEATVHPVTGAAIPAGRYCPVDNPVCQEAAYLVRRANAAATSKIFDDAAAAALGFQHRRSYRKAADGWVKSHPGLPIARKFLRGAVKVAAEAATAAPAKAKRVRKAKEAPVETPVPVEAQAPVAEEEVKAV
jgi:hypothetical protein